MSHSGAARKHRAGAISAVLVCLKSAEPFYEPSVLTPARSNNRRGFELRSLGRRSDAALRRGLRARPSPDPKQPATDTSKLEKN